MRTVSVFSICQHTQQAETHLLLKELVKNKGL